MPVNPRAVLLPIDLLAGAEKVSQTCFIVRLSVRDFARCAALAPVYVQNMPFPFMGCYRKAQGIAMGVGRVMRRALVKKFTQTFVDRHKSR
jgi:hypothetical protein